MIAINIANLVIIAIVIAAVIGIGMIAIRAAGLQIPPWVIQIFWIVVVVVVAIFAIKLVMGMA